MDNAREVVAACWAAAAARDWAAFGRLVADDAVYEAPQTSAGPQAVDNPVDTTVETPLSAGDNCRWPVDD